MAASIVQSGNASAKPGGTFTNPFGTLVGASAVTAGNTILAMVGYAYDSVSTTFTCTDTLLQTYTLVDYLSKSGDFNASLFICQNSLAMPAPVAKTLTGSLSAGATSATLSASWSGSTAVYIITFSSGEVRPVNLTNGSTSMSWPDGLGSTSTSSITVGYGPYFQGTNDGDFGLAVAIEIGGVPSSGVLIAHNAAINSAVAIGSNNINSGSLACGSGSGLMVSVVLNVGNGNASPTFTPKVGTSPVSFSQFGSSFWDFGSSALGIVQSAHLTAPGTLTPTAGTQETVADEYFVWAAYLADATQPATPAAYWRRSPGPGPGKFARFYQSPKSYAVAANITAALSGQSATFAAGTSVPGLQVAATGQSAPFTAGAVLPAAQVAASGQSAAFTAGTLIASSAINLNGQSSVFSAGSLTPSLSLGLSGQSAAFSAGTLLPSTIVGLTGQIATFSAGTVTTGSDVTVNITGQAAAFSAGVLAPSTSIALLGGAASFATGNLAPSLAGALTGASVASTSGTVSPASSIALQGLSATFTAGILGVVGDVTVGLTGAQANFNAGTLSIPAVQTQDAGRRIRNIYRVTIDGQVFEFRTLPEALKLLEQAKALAAKVAEDAEIWQQAPKAPPTITVSSRELRKAAAETKREIQATYDKAALHGELRMLMELARRHEEDDTILLLM